MKLFILLLSVTIVCNGEIVKNEDEEEISNPDDFADIERPCQVYDFYCIRKFFASHGRCIIVSNGIAEPNFRSQYTVYLSGANITTIFTNHIELGPNSTRIEEFYVNKATNKIVFAINIRNLIQTATGPYFELNRRAREPLVLTLTPANGIRYSSVTFTAIIPFKEEILLEEAEVTPFIDDPRPQLYFVPENLSSLEDPIAVAEVTAFVTNMPATVQELMYSQSAYYPSLYIQKNICDFGLKVF